MKIAFLSSVYDILGIATRVLEEGHDVSVYIKDRLPGTTSTCKLVDAWRPLIVDRELFVCDGLGWGRYSDLLSGRGKRVFGCNDLIDHCSASIDTRMRTLSRLGIPIVPHAIVGSEPISPPFERSVAYAVVPVGIADPLVLETREALYWLQSKLVNGSQILVQEVVGGYYASIEGFFNGRDWVEPLFLFVTRRGMLDRQISSFGVAIKNKDAGISTPMRALSRVLRKVSYHGYVSLLVVVTPSGELLARDVRFGLTAGSVECVLEACSMRISAADVLFGVADGSLDRLDPSWDYIAGLRLSAVPVAKLAGSPVAGISHKNSNHLWLMDYSPSKGLGGSTFSVGLTTAIGRDTKEAMNRVYRTASNVKYLGKIIDTGLKFAAADLQCLVGLGVL